MRCTTCIIRYGRPANTRSYMPTRGFDVNGTRAHETRRISRLLIIFRPERSVFSNTIFRAIGSGSFPRIFHACRLLVCLVAGCTRRHVTTRRTVAHAWFAVLSVRPRLPGKPRFSTLHGVSWTTTKTNSGHGRCHFGLRTNETIRYVIRHTFMIFASDNEL